MGNSYFYVKQLKYIKNILSTSQKSLRKEDFIIQTFKKSISNWEVDRRFALNLESPGCESCSSYFPCENGRHTMLWSSPLTHQHDILWAHTQVSISPTLLFLQLFTGDNSETWDDFTFKPLSSAGLHNLNTVDFWDWIILCCEGLSPTKYQQHKTIPFKTILSCPCLPPNKW